MPKVLLAALALLLIAPVQAEETPFSNRTGVYLTGGTGGLGLGVARGLSERFTLRGEYTSTRINREVTEGESLSREM